MTDKSEGEKASPRAIQQRTHHARRRLLRALRPRFNRAQIIVALLCFGLGFALVVQVQQNQAENLGSLRQSELVRLLDEVTNQSNNLASTERELRRTRDELLSGSDSARTALEATSEQVTRQAILAGTVPVNGPGVTVKLTDRAGDIDALVLLEVVQELRNAGAEAIDVNGQRLGTSSWFLDSEDGIVLDGSSLESPYEFTAIGESSTISAALEMPGGVLTGIRSRGATATLDAEDYVEIDSIREPSDPKFATPENSS